VSGFADASNGVVGSTTRIDSVGVFGIHDVEGHGVAGWGRELTTRASTGVTPPEPA